MSTESNGGREPDVSGRDHDAGHSAQGVQTASVARPETSGEICIGTCQLCGAYWDLLLYLRCPSCGGYIG